MKNLKYYFTSIFFGIIITLLSVIGLNAECLTSCTTEEGLSVRIMQSSTGWSMNIFEGTEIVGSYQGDGQYSGTICHGNTPCTVSEA